MLGTVVVYNGDFFGNMGIENASQKEQYIPHVCGMTLL